MIGHILIALAIVVVGILVYLVGNDIAENARKKPNPEIELIAKTFNLVPIKEHYSHHSWVIFKNAQEFINHAPKNIKGIFVEDGNNYIFYFYHLRGYDFCVELPKRV